MRLVTSVTAEQRQALLNLDAAIRAAAQIIGPDNPSIDRMQHDLVDLRGAPEGRLLDRVRTTACHLVGGGFVEVRFAPSHFSVENGCLSRVLKVNRSRVWEQLAVEAPR